MKRQGKTGIWAFLIETPEGKIKALSEWGTVYEFDKRYWEKLPELPTEKSPVL